MKVSVTKFGRAESEAAPNFCTPMLTLKSTLHSNYALHRYSSEEWVISSFIDYRDLLLQC